MPVVDERSSGERKNVWVTYQSITDKLMEKKDGTVELRVIFDVKDTRDETVSLGVPILDPQVRLRPFIDPSGAPTNEASLRTFIEERIGKEPVFASVWNNFIQEVILPPGTYRVKLKDLRRFTRSRDGMERVAIHMQTDDSKETSWTYPWPEMECILGSTGEEDGFHGFSADAGLFETLIACGLDWNKWKTEMRAAPRLYNRPGLEGPEKGILGDPEDITGGLLLAVNRHTESPGGNPVQIEVVETTDYGIGPKRVKNMVNLTPVIVEGPDPAFDKEVEVLGILWDSLTVRVLKDDDARFLVAGEPGKKDGMLIAKGILVPVVHKWPDLVRLHKEDGTPRLPFPITPKGWRLNGLAVLGFVAKRLLALDDGELFQVVNLSDPTSLLAWAEENITELSDDMTVDEGVEL